MLNSTWLLFTKDQVGNLLRREPGQIVSGLHKHREMEATAFQVRHLGNVSSTHRKLISRSQHSVKQHPLAFKSHIINIWLEKNTSLNASHKRLLHPGRRYYRKWVKTSCWTNVHTTVSQEKQTRWKVKGGSPLSWYCCYPWAADSTCLGFQETREQLTSRK